MQERWLLARSSRYCPDCLAATTASFSSNTAGHGTSCGTYPSSSPDPPTAGYWPTPAQAAPSPPCSRAVSYTSTPAPPAGARRAGLGEEAVRRGRRGLTALFWSSVNRYGTFRLDMNKRLDLLPASVPHPRTPAEADPTAMRADTCRTENRRARSGQQRHLGRPRLVPRHPRRRVRLRHGHLPPQDQLIWADVPSSGTARRPSPAGGQRVGAGPAGQRHRDLLQHSA
jgi:hypothetical protein